VNRAVQCKEKEAELSAKQEKIRDSVIKFEVRHSNTARSPSGVSHEATLIALPTHRCLSKRTTPSARVR
jgi:hypothetical protein